MSFNLPQLSLHHFRFVPSLSCLTNMLTLLTPLRLYFIACQPRFVIHITMTLLFLFSNTSTWSPCITCIHYLT